MADPAAGAPVRGAAKGAAGRLAVRLTPGAARDAVDGWEADAQGRPLLKVRVRARPVEGEANAALIRLLAGALGVPRRDVELLRGGRSRAKTVAFRGLDEAEIRRRLQAAGEPPPG